VPDQVARRGRRSIPGVTSRRLSLAIRDGDSFRLIFFNLFIGVNRVNGKYLKDEAAFALFPVTGVSDFAVVSLALTVTHGVNGLK
jgi:hypothetical protein